MLQVCVTTPVSVFIKKMSHKFEIFDLSDREPLLFQHSTSIILEVKICIMFYLEHKHFQTSVLQFGIH